MFQTVGMFFLMLVCVISIVVGAMFHDTGRRIWGKILLSVPVTVNLWVIIALLLSIEGKM